jgi:allantoin racemase
MTARVLVVSPSGTSMHNPTMRAALDRAALPGIEADIVNLDGVPATAFLPHASVYHDALLSRVLRAADEGYDAVVVSCAADPAVAIARPISRIPIVGPMEAALHTSASLGGRLGIITAKLRPAGEFESQPTTVNWARELIHNYGFTHRIAGIRSVRPAHPDGADMQALLDDDPERLRIILCDGLADAANGEGLGLARDLIEQDDATEIFFACTEWSGLLDAVRTELPVPVLDPLVTAVRYAAMLGLAAK